MSGLHLFTRDNCSSVADIGRAIQVNSPEISDKFVLRSISYYAERHLVLYGCSPSVFNRIDFLFKAFIFACGSDA